MGQNEPILAAKHMEMLSFSLTHSLLFSLADINRAKVSVNTERFAFTMAEMFDRKMKHVVTSLRSFIYMYVQSDEQLK